MKIAVLSGKGGTGKTTVSTNLAFISKDLIIDTDIEAPNSHIFLKGKDFVENSVFTFYPKIDMEKCNLCGECGKFCRYNAIIPAKNRVIVFEESCHFCGGCELVCKNKAISWEKREIGKILEGRTFFDSEMKYGKLNIGEMSGVKIIKQLYKETKKENFIIDCPPGTACTTVTAVEKADFAIVVTESSPFGLNDMKLVIKLLEKLKIPFGVVINKAGLTEDETEIYCNEKNIEILGKIPFDKEIAQLYSKGELIVNSSQKYRDIFKEILEKVKKYGM